MALCTANRPIARVAPNATTTRLVRRARAGRGRRCSSMSVAGELDASKDLGWQYRLTNIGRIAVAESVLISDGSTFIFFCSLSHHPSVSVCICLLHSLRKRSTRASYARNLAQGQCIGECYTSDGHVACESEEYCGGCDECKHGPPGTSGEGTALLIHVCRW